MFEELTSLTTFFPQEAFYVMITGYRNEASKIFLRYQNFREFFLLETMPWSMVEYGIPEVVGVGDEETTGACGIIVGGTARGRIFGCFSRKPAIFDRVEDMLLPLTQF